LHSTQNPALPERQDSSKKKTSSILNAESHLRLQESGVGTVTRNSKS
jgi:hypothetical protein